MFELSEKLKSLKKILKFLNLNTFGNAHSLVKQTEVFLNKVQLDIQNDIHFVVLRDKERDCLIQLEKALHNENLFWKEKTHVK